MVKERAHIDLDDDQIDLEDLTGKPQHNRPSAEQVRKTVTKVSENSGFVSREPKKKGKVGRPKSTVYLIQKNIKMRLGMPEILAKLTAATGGNSDQETIEKALLALIEKEGLKTLKAEYEKLL